MAIQYCRWWYLTYAACIVAYALTADITWLQWTEQSGSYIGLSSETSRVHHSGAAAKCKSERGVIIDPTVVDVTSPQFATLILECVNLDITNSNFWVNGPEEEGYCSGIVLQGGLFVNTVTLCTAQTRYICHSTQDRTAESCAATRTTTGTITAEITKTATAGESFATGITTGGSTTTDKSAVSDIGSDLAVYAALAVGGAAILIIVTLLIVYRERKTRHESPTGHVYVNAGSVTKTHTTTAKHRTSSLNSSGAEAVPPSNSNVNVNQGGDQELKQGGPQEDNPDYVALSSSSREPLPQETPYEGITGIFDPELHDQVRGGGVPYAEFTIQSAHGSQRGDDTPYEDVTGVSL